jgi:hypothetical protein
MKIRSAMALGVLSALSATAGSALGAATDDATVNCVDLRRIDHTKVVDDRNILFYMRGGGIYLNRMQHPAIGLDQSDMFAYRTHVGQLCELDTITVLERWGFGLTEGASSTLAKFMPIDKDRADAMLNGAQAE